MRRAALRPHERSKILCNDDVAYVSSIGNGLKAGAEAGAKKSQSRAPQEAKDSTIKEHQPQMYYAAASNEEAAFCYYIFIFIYFIFAVNGVA